MIVILTLFLKYYDVNLIYLVIYLFEKDKLIKLALAAWYLKKRKLEFNKYKMFQSYF